MVSLLLMSQICTVLAMVLNTYATNWFDFQNTCRLLRQEMPSGTHHEMPYWTKYYKRQSEWIGKYGCYYRTDLTGTKSFNLHFPSAGLCQELCMEDNESNTLLFFGVHKEKCICLSKHPATPSLVLNQCNFDCLTNNFLNYSMECRGSVVYNVFVSGKELSKPDQRNILSCQQCTKHGCLFANCTSHLNIKYCTKNVLSTAHPSFLKTTSKQDTITVIDESIKFIVGGLAFSTVICFLFLMVAINVFRRKHTSIEDKFSTLQKQIECSRFRHEEGSIAELNPQNKPGHQNVTGASYYELPDNSKLNEKCYKTKKIKEPYYDIKPVTGNDIYMVASCRMLDGESVIFDRKKGSYDHLGETSRFRHEENTYDHAGNVNESSYSCAEVARNWNDRQMDNDLYDHI